MPPTSRKKPPVAKPKANPDAIPGDTPDGNPTLANGNPIPAGQGTPAAPTEPGITILTQTTLQQPPTDTALTPPTSSATTPAMTESANIPDRLKTPSTSMTTSDPADAATTAPAPTDDSNPAGAATTAPPPTDDLVYAVDRTTVNPSSTSALINVKNQDNADALGTILQMLNERLDRNERILNKNNARLNARFDNTNARFDAWLDARFDETNARFDARFDALKDTNDRFDTHFEGIKEDALHLETRITTRINALRADTMTTETRLNSRIDTESTRITQMADNMVNKVLETAMPQAYAKVDTYITKITDVAIDRKIDVAIKNGFDHRITKRLDEGIKDSIAEDGRINCYVNDCTHANTNDAIARAKRELSQVTDYTTTRLDSLEESYCMLKAEMKSTGEKVETLHQDVLVLEFLTKSSPGMTNIQETMDVATEDQPLSTGKSNTMDAEAAPPTMAAATEEPPDRAAPPEDPAVTSIRIPSDMTTETSATDPTTTPTPAVAVPPTHQRFANVTLSPVRPRSTPPTLLPTMTIPSAYKPAVPVNVAPTHNATQSASNFGRLPPIPHPRNRTSFQRDKIALQQRISRKDITQLANTHYHRGPHSLPIITDRELIECGYTTDTHYALAEVLVCYNDIIAIHRKVYNNWANDRYGTDGPQINRIVSKELAAFPCLISTSAEDVVDFYNRFHEMGASYLLPTTPLDAIVLHFGYEGLFPPALGTMRYSACGRGLLELLQHLVPSTLSPAFNALLSTVRSESANGYDLLWRMLRHYVPGFDRAKPIVFPFWTESTNIFVFAKLTMMYFRLQQLHKAPFSDYDKSITFLNGLAGSDYTNQVNTLLTTVKSYNLDEAGTDFSKAGLLPEHLRIPALASCLNHFALRRMSTALMPYANWLNFNERYPEIIPPTQLPSPQLAYRVGTNPPRHSHIGPTPGAPCHGQPNRVSFQHQTPKNIPNPSRTRRPFVNTQCPACGKVGHTMQTCDMLAMAISLKRYMTNQISAEMMNKIEREWLAKHRERIQQLDARTPQQVLRTFADNYDLTVAEIDNQMDWNGWEYDSLTDLTMDTMDTSTTNTEVTTSE